MTIVWYMEYGPYSPQEIERIIEWLNQKAISFHILRNDQDEKESLMNDGLNAVRLADLRTGIYLGQIFYIQLENASESIHQQFVQKFSLPQEKFAYPERFQVSSSEEANLATDARGHEKLQRSWAMWLAIAMVISIALGLFLNAFYK